MFTPIFLYILIGVYLVAVNFYGIIILKDQKNSVRKSETPKISDLRLLFTALIGGAAGIFTFMLIQKYRMNSLLLMVSLPVITTLNVYLIIFAISKGTMAFGV